MQSVFRHHNRILSLDLQREAEDTFVVAIDGEKQTVHAELIDPTTLRVVAGGVARTVRIVRAGKDHHVAVGGQTYVLAPEATGAAAASSGTLANPQIIAPMPGKVLQVLVTEGQQVAEGDGLLILEAMKMENRIVAEADGTVKKVNVSVGQMVDGGMLMMELDYGAAG
jgi:biotin carboxyl carrier protein